MIVIFISLSIFVSYLLLYTAYSKQTKKLEIELLLTVLLVRDSLDKTLVEYNKVLSRSPMLSSQISLLRSQALSLSGLTLFCVAWLPGLHEWRWGLIWSSMVQLWVHSLYSSWKFYGSPNIPHLSTWPHIFKELRASEAKDVLQGIKKISIILGTLGQLILSGGYLQWLSTAALCYGGLSLGIAHFYSMEIDFKWKLQVRPYAYLPFPLALAAIACCYCM